MTPQVDHPRHPVPQDSVFSRAKPVLLGFAIVAGVLLLFEHRAHVLPFLPWLLLAACPLMHLFMHHGHHAHGRNELHGDGRRP